MAVEAYHAGYIRTALIQNGDVVTPYGANIITIIDAISMARMKLDGSASIDDVGIFNATVGDYTLAPVDSNAVAFSRTPSQVLAVAYLNAAGSAGGFFPMESMARFSTAARSSIVQYIYSCCSYACCTIIVSV